MKRASKVVPRHYYVEGGGGWFVVHCSTKRIARQHGVATYGHGQTKLVRPATLDDIASYRAWHGDHGPLPLEDYPCD